MTSTDCLSLCALIATTLSTAICCRVEIRLTIQTTGQASRYTAANEMIGLSTSGWTNPFPRNSQRTDALAASPAPTSAPVMACVVETGKPVNVAKITQPNAPISTDEKNAMSSVVPLANNPVLKLLSRPPEN